jgi:branched-subunit amino acid ABC-type transport system permease component
MYEFAVVALLALATLKLVDYVSEVVEPLRKLRSLLTFVVAVGGVAILDYSVFAGWGIEVRNDDLGKWVTGFMVAGLTVPWRAIFGYLTHDRAASDETLGEHTRMRAA